MSGQKLTPEDDDTDDPKHNPERRLHNLAEDILPHPRADGSPLQHRSDLSPASTAVSHG